MTETNFTLEDLAKLKSAIAQGALIVQYQDRKVQYRSLNEMLTLRNLMMRELGITTGQATRIPLEFDGKLS